MQKETGETRNPALPILDLQLCHRMVHHEEGRASFLLAGSTSVAETDMISVGEPLPLIANVTPADAYVVIIEWRSGTRGEMIEQINLAPHILSFKIFRSLRHDRALFETVHVAADGAAIAWGGNDEIDMPATAIERLAGEAF
jgi:hypothetical protein